MIVPLVALVGVAALAVGWIALAGFGPALRIGRLLSTARAVSTAEAAEFARRGVRRYVLVRGRIDSDGPFEDEHHRPLVLRRDRLETLQGRGWRVLRESRRDAPFVLQDHGGAIAVDVASLGEGLVVLPREAEGIARDVPEHVPAGLDPEQRVRLRVEQVSSVEHAYAAGVPGLAPDGQPWLTAGLGRPLIVTTLERAEAMRILAGGQGVRAAFALGLLVVGLGCLVLALVLAAAGLVLPAAALAASPEPTLMPSGDTRSSGEGAGLVGAPLLVAAAIVLLGLVAAGLATLYARLSGER